MRIKRKVNWCCLGLVIACLFCLTLLSGFGTLDNLFRIQLFCVVMFLSSLLCILFSAFDFFKHKNRFACYGMIVGFLTLLFVPEIYVVILRIEMKRARVNQETP